MIIRVLSEVFNSYWSKGRYRTVTAHLLVRSHHMWPTSTVGDLGVTRRPNQANTTQKISSHQSLARVPNVELLSASAQHHPIRLPWTEYIRRCLGALSLWLADRIYFYATNRPEGVKPQAIRYPKALRHEVALVIDRYQYPSNVAKAYGLVEQTVYNWVRREHQLRIRNLAKMANAAEQRTKLVAEQQRNDVLHGAD